MLAAFLTPTAANVKTFLILHGRILSPCTSAAIFQAWVTFLGLPRSYSTLFRELTMAGTMNTQVTSADFGRVARHQFISRLKKCLSKPDSAPAMTRANSVFGLGWAQEIAAIMPVRHDQLDASQE